MRNWRSNKIRHNMCCSQLLHWEHIWISLELVYRLTCVYIYTYVCVYIVESSWRLVTGRESVRYKPQHSNSSSPLWALYKHVLNWNGVQKHQTSKSYMCKGIYIYIYTLFFKHIYIYTCVCVYIHVYGYIYIYISQNYKKVVISFWKYTFVYSAI